MREKLRLGSLMIPDLNHNGYWIPYEISSVVVDDDPMRYMDKAVLEKIEQHGIVHLRTSSGILWIGRIDLNTYELESMDIEIQEVEKEKPFITKKRCPECNEDYDSYPNFQFCEKCGKELVIR